MKRSRGISKLFFLLTTIGVVAVIYFRGESLLKFTIESYGYEICDCQIQLETLRWKATQPLALTATGLVIDKVDSRLTVSKVSLRLRPLFLDKALFWRLKGVLTVDKVELILREQGVVESSGGPPGVISLRSFGKYFESIRRLDLSTSINQADVIRQSGSGKSLALQFSKFSSQLQGEPFSLGWTFGGTFEAPTLLENQVIPISSKGILRGAPDRLELVDSRFEVFGLPIEINGRLSLRDNAMEIVTHIKDFEVSALANLPLKHPLRDWTGNLGSVISFEQLGEYKPWQLKGELRATNLRGPVKFKGVGYNLEGPVSFNMNLKGSYNSEKKIEISSGQWKLDLTEALLQLDQLLTKVANIKLKSEGKIQWTEQLSIESLSLELDQFLGQIEGSLNWVKKDADLDFTLQPFRLEGMERLFPFLSQHPLSGKVEASGHWLGSFEALDKANIIFDQIVFEKVRGNIDWKSADLILRGPFVVDLQGGLNVMGKTVKEGEIQLDLNLSGMEIAKQKLFQKTAGSPFEIALTAQEDKGALRLRNGQVKGPFGALKLEGITPLPPAWAIDFTLSTNQLLLQPLKKMMPEFAEKIPEGQIKGYIHWKGQLNTSDLMNSRIQTQGNLRAWIPQFVSQGQGDASPSSSSKGASQEALLASNKVLQGLDLVADLKVDNLKIGALSLGDLNVVGKLSSGIFSGRSIIGKIFNGRVEVSAFELPLFTVDPSMPFKIKAEKLNLADPLALFLPPFKGLASGNFSGEFSGRTRWPSSPNFLTDLQSFGKFMITDGTLHSLFLKEYLDHKLKSIPGGADISKKIDFKNVSLGLASDFKLTRGDLMVAPLMIYSAEGHKLFFEGKIGLDQRLSLDGHLALGNLAASGSFIEANRDSQGDVIIPLKIDGALTKPQFYIVDEILTKMVRNTLDYEKTKAVRSVTKDVEKKVKSAKEQLEDKLHKQLEKEFKRLFK